MSSRGSLESRSDTFTYQSELLVHVNLLLYAKFPSHQHLSSRLRNLGLKQWNTMTSPSIQSNSILMV
uniref:Uncharacterized protein n=1 Tax=Lepeophtheirus salmonis TaxID=72036 RepID=A0A0K2VBT4_LEPSM